LNKYCSKITIAGKNKDWAISSHYTGDIRSIYMPVLEGFLLKSLNAISTLDVGMKYKIVQNEENDKYAVGFQCSNPNCHILHSSIREGVLDYFDHVILCTGWKFDQSIFNFDVQSTLRDKYPSITNKYESVNNKNLYFIGTLMHSLDYKKSSGAFIHGFRYLIKHFFNINYTKMHDMNSFTTIQQTIDHIMFKINVSSPMYQMYGVLSDLFFYYNHTFFYFNNVPKQFYETELTKISNTIYFVISLEYGNTITDLNMLGKRVSDLGNENKSPLLLSYSLSLSVSH
jgi:hypothetical protein